MKNIAEKSHDTAALEIIQYYVVKSNYVFNWMHTNVNSISIYSQKYSFISYCFLLFFDVVYIPANEHSWNLRKLYRFQNNTH